jgi:hypothetical protein
MTAMTVNIWFTPHKNLVEKVKLTKLACLIASTTHQDKEWSISEKNQSHVCRTLFEVKRT